MSAPLSPWTVVVTSPGHQEVARSALRAGVPIQVGRAPDCTITLNAMTVARYHGRIELAANGIPTYTAENSAPALIDGDPVEGPTQLGERTLLEIAGFSIRMERNRVAAPAPQKPAAAAPTAATPEAAGGIETLLDRHIQGVRLHRNVNQQETQGRAEKFEQDWRTVVANLRTIKVRYGTHPAVLDFGVAKDDSEVTIKLREQSARGYAYFCLSRRHPEGRFSDLMAIWLRQVGSEDMSFEVPAKGLEELISRLAPRLA